VCSRNHVLFSNLILWHSATQGKEDKKMITLALMAIVGYLVWPYGLFWTALAVFATWQVVDFVGMLLIGAITARRGF
jgi:hypothetical protein